LSAQDANEYGHLLADFRNRPVSLSVAANSLKIYVEARSHYLWIDPPWRLVRFGKVLASSLECPLPTAEFRRWALRIHRFFGPIVQIRTNAAMDISLRLATGASIKIPRNKERRAQPDWWYDHWYVRTPDA